MKDSAKLFQTKMAIAFLLFYGICILLEFLSFFQNSQNFMLENEYLCMGLLLMFTHQIHIHIYMYSDRVYFYHKVTHFLIIRHWLSNKMSFKINKIDYWFLKNLCCINSNLRYFTREYLFHCIIFVFQYKLLLLAFGKEKLVFYVVWKTG